VLEVVVGAAWLEELDADEVYLAELELLVVWLYEEELVLVGWVQLPLFSAPYPQYLELELVGYPLVLLDVYVGLELVVVESYVTVWIGCV